MAKLYYDSSAALQVLGCLMHDTNLLKNDGVYFLREEDFVTEIHKVVYKVINNLEKTGSTKVSILDIENYLEDRPKSKATYTQGGGHNFLTQIYDSAQLDSFKVYYDKLKKMTLLRFYHNSGIDISDIYEIDSMFDVQKSQQQLEYLEKATLSEIADRVEGKLQNIRMACVENAAGYAIQAGSGIMELLQSLKNQPDVGIPFFGKYMNTITRGARAEKFMLISAPTNVGKTRIMVSQAAYFACNEMCVNDEWVNIGAKNPTLYIATEQTMPEIQTMLLSFISGVNEQFILDGSYSMTDYNKLVRAAKVLEESPLYVEVIPDFSVQDIENIIKRNIKEHGIVACCYDYLHTSMKILEEVTRRSGGVKLREDTILYLLSVKLKEICTEYGIFILTATQVNASYLTNEELDQNCLRGAKAIADKADTGFIMVNTTKEDKEAIENIVKACGCPMPNVKISIYKNRRGGYNKMYLFLNADKGCCRYEPVFATDFDYNFMDIEDFKIEVE